MIYFNTKVKKFRLLKKLDAYLRSPGLSVGNKLCFLCLHLFKFFFNAIIGLSCHCFFLLVCQRCRFLTYVYRAENSIYYAVWRDPFWGGVRGGSVIHNWLLFQYLLLDTIFIFFLFFLSIDLIVVTNFNQSWFSIFIIFII